ncbi:hypothetical protein CTAYLR_009325 [Chrysophaeum taylorii]|uniref:GST N-terminal domain-containing protein n=1 Tax=Chrysophaeum taylorii TaxID=2483200 RepID=A0AAD7UHA3_9STRA|nr:hypothetical protein CTAYLR_009325 [Chrysophaeum taylorii]
MTLYAYRICPFCCKVKAAARASRVAIKTVEVNPLTKSQIAFSRDHRKVPIAVFQDGRVLVESDRIVDELVRDAEPAFKSDEARHWSRWASQDLALMIYPNITRSFSECRETLAYADEAFSPLEAWAVRWIGAAGMSLAHSKVKRKYGIEDERDALRRRLDEWNDQVELGPFRAGHPAPDLGDVAVFGVLGAVAGTRAHAEIMSDYPAIAAWATAVDAALPP